MHLVTQTQEVLSQVAAILTGDPGDERSFCHHVTSNCRLIGSSLCNLRSFRALFTKNLPTIDSSYTVKSRCRVQSTDLILFYRIVSLPKTLLVRFARVLCAFSPSSSPRRRKERAKAPERPQWHSFKALATLFDCYTMDFGAP